TLNGSACSRSRCQRSGVVAGGGPKVALDGEQALGGMVPEVEDHAVAPGPQCGPDLARLVAWLEPADVVGVDRGNGDVRDQWMHVALVDLARSEQHLVELLAVAEAGEDDVHGSRRFRREP